MWRDEQYRRSEQLLYGSDLETLTRDGLSGSQDWLALLEGDAEVPAPEDMQRLVVEGLVFLLPKNVLGRGDLAARVAEALAQEVRAYRALIAAGVPEEDARLILPDSFTGLKDTSDS